MSAHLTHLTAEQAALRASDLARLTGLTSALSEAVSDSYIGLDCRTSSDIHSHLMAPQDQREADLLAFGDDDISDPAYKDWCQPARLMTKFADPDLGVNHLKEVGDNHTFEDVQIDDDENIAKAIHQAIYLTEKQLENKHDRILMDVPKSGHRKGGTHGIAPENRRARNAKIVNETLTCKALVQIPGEDDVHEVDRLERAEAEAFYHSTNAQIARHSAYVLSKYTGKYSTVLKLLLQGKENSEIAELVGKSERRIRQIVNGNASKGRKPKPGLYQIINELMSAGVPSDFQSPAPVLVPMPVTVQPVHTLKKSLQKEAVLGQLGWDFDAFFDALMGVAA
ncbi:hypothetical protein BBC27_08115 [Acidithiobacillus ferrivorans]|uniref:Uncharacterized protein n=1 Tax=Acidithiobacillus ferrivorans TaxID=160808 RepID=A0A1B9C0F5_9PROT|nr:hypothetical protein [Acidithiobacillus ferrivorans]OCB03421.1 hypothetical protein BBC27_08115 [Acidithiobacillus ferrivorans]